MLSEPQGPCQKNPVNRLARLLVTQEGAAEASVRIRIDGSKVQTVWTVFKLKEEQSLRNL